MQPFVRAVDYNYSATFRLQSPLAAQLDAQGLPESNHILMFFERWMRVIPTPLGASDRAAGYWWELSMRQIEVGRTAVFDAPRRARAFFEALVADNLDTGRPDEIELIFGRQVRKNTCGTFKTKVVTRGVDVTLNAFYRHSRIKEYLKEGRALRIETVVNSPTGKHMGCFRVLDRDGAGARVV